MVLPYSGKIPLLQYCYKIVFILDTNFLGDACATLLIFFVVQFSIKRRIHHIISLSGNFNYLATVYIFWLSFNALIFVLRRPAPRCRLYRQPSFWPEQQPRGQPIRGQRPRGQPIRDDLCPGRRSQRRRLLADEWRQPAHSRGQLEAAEQLALLLTGSREHLRHLPEYFNSFPCHYSEKHKRRMYKAYFFSLKKCLRKFKNGENFRI